MRRRVVLAGAMTIVLTVSALAQSSAPAGAPAPAGNSAVPGDHWTYEVKDDVSGEIKDTRTFTVTDISKNEIAVRSDSNKTGNSNNFIYDQSWNVVRGPVFKFSPNDGSGVKLPLSPDSQWKISINSTNVNNGQAWKRTGSGKVTGQEKITTKAGTFDTFVVETNMVIKNIVDPTRSEDVVTRIWYNSDINHWVKRSFVLRQNGHLFQSETMELTAYGRKKT